MYASALILAYVWGRAGWVYHNFWFTQQGMKYVLDGQTEYPLPLKLIPRISVLSWECRVLCLSLTEKAFWVLTLRWQSAANYACATSHY